MIMKRWIRFFRGWHADEVGGNEKSRFPCKAVMYKKRGTGTVGRKFSKSGWLDEL